MSNQASVYYTPMIDKSDGKRYCFYIQSMSFSMAAAPSVDLKQLPKSSLFRIYHPGTWGNSFALDGFPALKEGKSWPARLIEFIELKGAACMTTNQTLFRQLLETGTLDDRLRAFVREGKTASQVYQALYNEATMQAAQIFSGLHAQWPHEGRVSQEASALLTELEPLLSEVRRISAAMTGAGAFTKIPNLAVGPQAVRRAVATGQVSPNVTLVFSDQHYLDTAEGYLLGLNDLVERLRGEGALADAIRKTVSAIHSVNSLFVSRIDRVVDPWIDESIRQASFGLAQDDRARQLKLLKGKVAVAQAKKIYAMFETVFLGKPFADPEGLYAAELPRLTRMKESFARLKTFGANPQRLLIASSGVKSDQPYSPLLYALPFLGPWSANTMPEGTFEAAVKFVASLSDEQSNALRERNLMSEPLPEIATDIQPVAEWDRILQLTPAQRTQQGIGSLTADQILKQAQQWVLTPKNSSLRQIGDSLRDKGAESFFSDEKATLQAIETKLQQFR
jgi:transaldolase